MELDLVPRLGAVIGIAIVLAVLALLLRWTYGHQKHHALPTDDPDDPVATGLLTEVSRVPGPEAARVLRDRLRSEGIRATTSRADDGGWALLVFPRDVGDARVVLSRRSLD